MKKKFFVIPLIMLSCLTLTSCSFFFRFDYWFSSKDDNQDDKTTSVSYDDKYNNGLLIYHNESPLNNKKGGGFDDKIENLVDINLDYNYADYTSHSIYKNIDSMPSTGDVNILVIPVKFPDYNNNATEAVRQKIYDAYFGDEVTTGFESVASYFYESSYGNLRISGVVSDWYQTNYLSSISSEKSTAELAKKAYSWFENKYSKDIENNKLDFDADNDGYVDCLCLIYNAPYLYRQNDNLWAYTYWCQQKPGDGEAQLEINTYIWASFSFMFDSKYTHIDAHTYIHEMGHAMGLEDYYNYEDSSRGSTGGFIMQDNNVGDHDPFSKMALGWVTPTIINGDTTVDIEPFVSSGQVLIYSSKKDGMNSPFDEYIAIEFYAPEGLNKFDTDHLLAPGYAQGSDEPGIRIWHVNALLAEFKSLSSINSYSITDEINSNYYYVNATSNSTGDSNGSLIESYRKYKMLHLIQKGGINTYADGELFSKDDLFQTGDSFRINKYQSMFVNKDKFDMYQPIDLEINIKLVSSKKATLEIIC